MKSYETMEDARRVASEVLAGAMDPYLGCGLIGAIGGKLNHHADLMEFVHLAHLQEGHEHVGFTKADLT